MPNNWARRSRRIIEGRVEVGYYPIRPTAAGHALCPDWPERVYHWHGEGFQLPCGAELLAEGDDFPVQAFQHGHAFGFQFHPDVTYAMMHRWTTRGCVRMEQPGAHPRHLHFADRAVHDVTERAWLKQFHRTAGSRARRARSCWKRRNSRHAEFARVFEHLSKFPNVLVSFA